MRKITKAELVIFWLMNYVFIYISFGWSMILSRIYGPEKVLAILKVFGAERWIKISVFVTITGALCVASALVLRFLVNLMVKSKDAAERKPDKPMPLHKDN
jgi:hypothetical protein